MTERLPFVLPYAGHVPSIAGTLIAAGERAAVLGRATIGPDASFGASAVIRADGHYVTAGARLFLSANATIHIAHDVYPTIVGDDVTVGVNAIVHACTVGDRCHVGDGAMILDGSRAGDDVAIEAGSVVVPRSVLENGMLYAGVPAKPMRPLAPGELDALHARTRGSSSGSPSGNAVAALSDPAVFRAATARFAGAVSAGSGSGIWFGCILDAGRQRIAIGDSTNVQDNSHVHAIDRDVTIGERTTIGHNVSLVDCAIAGDSLIGMGAVVASGTVVESDVLLAAGAWTEPGQVLESGWLYGGRPARKLAPLDEAKRDIIRRTWPVYQDYARRFAEAQAANS